MPWWQLCAVTFFPQPRRAVSLGSRTEQFPVTLHTGNRTTTSPQYMGYLPGHFQFSCLLIVCVLKYCWHSKSRTDSSSYPHWVILIKQFHSVWVLRPVHCLWLNPSLTSKWEDHSGALLCQNRTKSHLCVASATLTAFFKQPKNGLWTGSQAKAM